MTVFFFPKVIFIISVWEFELFSWTKYSNWKYSWESFEWCYFWTSSPLYIWPFLIYGQSQPKSWRSYTDHSWTAFSVAFWAVLEAWLPLLPAALLTTCNSLDLVIITLGSCRHHRDHSAESRTVESFSNFFLWLFLIFLDLRLGLWVGKSLTLSCTQSQMCFYSGPLFLPTHQPAKGTGGAADTF